MNTRSFSDRGASNLLHCLTVFYESKCQARGHCHLPASLGALWFAEHDPAPFKDVEGAADGDSAHKRVNVSPFQGQDFGPAGSGVEQCEEDPIERALAAYPLSAALICEILGVPTGDRGQFKTWVEDIGAFVGGVGSYAERAADQTDASRKELTRLFRELTLQRHREPRQDLISALAAIEGEEEGLTEQELLGLSVFLFMAGFETTLSLIANGMVSLLQNPGEMERLRRDPSLIETAVEEFLRYESPIQVDTRLVAEDVELRGRSLLKGHPVMMIRPAANRDPAQFPDPDRLDVSRENNKHLAFGWGIHFCLGAPLARIEAQIAVKTLLERLPEIRLESEDVVWWENMALRCPRSLPVAF